MYPDVPGTTARFRGLAVDQKGNPYFGDISHNALMKLTPAGDLSSLALNGSTVSALSPFAVDEDGDVYVGLTTQVWMIRSTGESVPVAGLSPGTGLGEGGPA